MLNKKQQKKNIYFRTHPTVGVFFIVTIIWLGSGVVWNNYHYKHLTQRHQILNLSEYPESQPGSGQLLIKVTNSLTDHDYAPGDIVGAYNSKRILDVHAQNIITSDDQGFNHYGLREPGLLLDIYLRNTKQYLFERISKNEVKRTDLWTKASSIISNSVNNEGEQMDVPKYIQRRTASFKHQVFGSSGFEYWYGGKTKITETGMDVVWTAIEKEKHIVRADFDSVPLTTAERLDYRVVAVADFTDTEAARLTSNVKIDGQEVNKRKYAINLNKLEHANSSNQLANASSIIQINNQESAVTYYEKHIKQSGADSGLKYFLKRTMVVASKFVNNFNAHAAGTVTVSIGTRAAENVNITSVTGTGPYTVTLSAAPSNTAVGDILNDEASVPKTYLITAIVGNDLTVRDAFSAGAAPSSAAVSQATTTRAYSTLTAWESALDNTSLYAAGDDAVGEMYNDSVFDETPNINGGGTVGLNSVLLTVASEHRHDGTAGTGARNIRSVTISTVITITANVDTSVEWLEVGSVAPRTATVIRDSTSAGSVSVKLRQLIISGAAETAGTISGIERSNNHPLSVHNSIIYNLTNTSSSGQDVEGVDLAGAGTTDVSIQNVTIHNLVNNNGSGKVYGARFNDSIYHTVRNVIVTNMVGTSSGSKVGFNEASPSSAIVGTNASSDNTAPGTGNLRSIVTADQYVSTAAGSEDLHLKSGSDAIDAGTDLGTTPTGVNIDINGRDRDVEGDTWDIGAHEYVVSGIAVSGTVYSDEGSTTMVGTQTVRVKVNGAGEYTASLSSGTYSISNVVIASAGDVLTVFLDGATEKATTVTRAANTTSAITGLNLYQNHLIVRHQDAGPVTNTNLDQYDSGNDADIPFGVSAGTLTVASGTTLLLNTSSTFTPGGTVTTPNFKQTSGTYNSGSNVLDVAGNFTLTGGAHNASSNNTYVGGDLLISGGTFTHNNGVVVIDGTGAQSINIPSSSVGALTINKPSETATINANLNIGASSLNITSGTLSQGSNYNLTAGAVTVGASGVWSNLSGGDVSLAGDVSNAGVITLNSNNGAMCIDGADSIVITSSSAGVQRTWSGAGTFNLYNLDVTDQSGSVTAYTSIFNNTTWTQGVCSGVTVSGTVYSDAGTTLISGTQTIRIKVNGAGSYSTTLSNGTYTIPLVEISAGGDVITAYLDGAAEKAVAVTIAADAESNVVNMDLYQNYLVLHHESGGTITNTNLSQYDSTNDADIGFAVTGGALVLSSGTSLWIDSGLTLNPGGDVTITDGSVAGSGIVTMSTGTLTVDGTGTFGGSSNWTLNNLTFGNGSGSEVTSSISTAEIAIAGTMTVTTSHSFNAGAATYNFSASGTPLVVSGSFDPEQSTIKYTNDDALTNTNVTDVDYYNLTVGPATQDEPNYILGTNTGQSVNVINTLHITRGVVDLDTYDLNLTLNNLIIDGTLIASPAADLTLSGNFTNNGVFTHNNGTITFSGSSESQIVSDGDSSIIFYNFTTLNAGGKTIKFEAGVPTKFEGTLTLIGTQEGSIVIDSTSSTQWEMWSTSSISLDRLVIKNSGCYLGTNTVNAKASVLDGGNNDSTCWNFIIRGGGVFNNPTGAGSGGSGAIGGGGSSSGSGSTGSGSGGSGSTGGGTDGGGGTASP